MLYYSLWDDQLNELMHTGRNSKTKTEVIEAGVDYLLGGSDFTDEERNIITNSTLEEKENFLNLWGIRLLEEDMPFEGYDTEG